MAAAVPVILGGIGGGAVGYGVATTLALGTVGTAVATATGAVVGASLMMPSPQAQAMEINDGTVTTVDTIETDDTDINTDSPTGGADTTINEITTLQEGLITTADTTVDNTDYSNVSSAGVASTGAENVAAASAVSTGVGEDSAIDFYERGRQATILTTPQGLLSNATTGVNTLLRPTPGLAGAGLIA
jgi:hypothetical protein